MNRTPLHLVELAGSPQEIAYQLGQKRRSWIEKRVDYWNRLTAQWFKGRRPELKSLEKDFLKWARKEADPYVEEIRAMAEGAGIPFADLFRLNLTELQAFTDKCSTVIFPFLAPTGRRILIAHNEDWDPKRNDVFILHAQLPEVSYAILAYDGCLPGLSSGVNSFGFCHAINYLKPDDFRIGLPRIFITRHLVTARNFDDMLSWIRPKHRAFGQSIHMARGEDYLGLELTAKKCVLRKIPLPTFHTNHYLDKQLAFIPPPGPSTVHRYRIGKKILQSSVRGHSKRDWTLEEAKRVSKKILSDRSGIPYAIWRENDTPEDSGSTVACALFDTQKLSLEVYRDRPQSSRAKLVTLFSPPPGIRDSNDHALAHRGYVHATIPVRSLHAR